MKNSIKIKKSRGASLVEFALLVSLVAMVCIAAVKVVGVKTAVPFVNASRLMSGFGTRCFYHQGAVSFTIAGTYVDVDCTGMW